MAVATPIVSSRVGKCYVRRDGGRSDSMCSMHAIRKGLITSLSRSRVGSPYPASPRRLDAQAIRRTRNSGIHRPLGLRICNKGCEGPYRTRSGFRSVGTATNTSVVPMSIHATSRSTGNSLALLCVLALDLLSAPEAYSRAVRKVMSQPRSVVASLVDFTTINFTTLYASVRSVWRKDQERAA